MRIGCWSLCFVWLCLDFLVKLHFLLLSWVRDHVLSVCAAAGVMEQRTHVSGHQYPRKQSVFVCFPLGSITPGSVRVG